MTWPTPGRPQPAMTGTELATSTTIKRPNNFNGIPGDSAGPRTDRAPGFSDLGIAPLAKRAARVGDEIQDA